LTGRQLGSRDSPQKWLKDYKIKSGPQNLNVQWDNPPISFFRLLFPEELVENLRLWTNTKAMMQIDNRQRKKNKRENLNTTLSNTTPKGSSLRHHTTYKENKFCIY